MHTHTLELRGFLNFTADEKRGALLMSRGCTLGLSLHNESQDVTLHPPENWLERQHALNESLARLSQPPPA